MAKSQKQRTSRRHNPTRVPDSHLPKGLDAAAQASTKAQAVLPIIQKLESADVADRVWACAAVCNLIQNDPSTRRLLQGKNIVGVLITRLSDSEDEVVVEAAGALRNLCIDGGYEICAEMFNKNIMAPLKTFIPKISTVLGQLLENPKSAPENAQKLAYEFSENVITILWCLSETSNKALNAINALRLAPFLMAFLQNREKLPVNVVTAAAQCLFVLTDDNEGLTAEVRGDTSYIACLLEVAQTAPPQPADQEMKVDGAPVANNADRITHLRVLACAILKNLAPLPPLTAAAAIDLDQAVILPLLTPLLSISLAETSSHVISLVPSISQGEPQNPSLKNVPKSDDRSPAEIELDTIEGRLRTVQLSLELLTGICATLPDPEPAPEGEEVVEDDIAEEDGDEWQDDDRAEERVLEMDVETGTTEAQTPSESTLRLLSLAEPLLALAVPTSLSFPPLPSSTEQVAAHPPTTSALGAIHVRALECLSNIFLNTPRLDAAPARALWDGVLRVLAAVGPLSGGPRIPGQERRPEMWDSGVGVLWGIARAAQGEMIPEEEHVRVLMGLCQTSLDPRLQVKCIGVLECLAQHRVSVGANKVIAEFLVGLLPSANGPGPVTVEPAVQAASAIIDIFSDEEAPYDVNFREGRYTERLVGVVAPLRKMVRAVDRRAEGGRELRARGDEVLENLVAFVKYRRNLGPGF
ncbi:ARM repeat-containing protein [Auricularia subglabra TFB-10046 SS5]|nr:ARM repeat-containing protein [Auricularia subglabra TFB-10046 SS5]